MVDADRKLAAFMETASDARLAPRRSTDLKGASFRERGAKKTAVVLHDLSISGCRVDWPFNLRVGEVVWLTLPGLEAIPGRVMWSRDFQVGVKFDTPLNEGVFNRVISAANA